MVILKRIDELRIDDPRDRRTGQLLNATIFDFQVNGPAAVALDKTPLTWLNGKFGNPKKLQQWTYLDPSNPMMPWPINFWMGSWDADSLTFYMGGTLKVYDLGAGFEGWVRGLK